MIARYFGSAFTGFFILSATSAAFAQGANCDEAKAQFEAAYAAQDLAALEAAEGKIQVRCDETVTKPFKYRRAMAEVRAALAIKNDASKKAEHERLLVSAAKSDVSWQADYLLGEYYLQTRNFSGAGAFLERSLELIKDPKLTPKAPTPAEITRIQHRAREAVLLAANEASGRAAFVAAPIDKRGNTLGGSLSKPCEKGSTSCDDEGRGIGLKTVPLPINFEFDSDKITSLGQEAARELARAIKEQDVHTVVLTGHTDNVGSDEYNMDLSQRRANAVAEFLKAELAKDNITVAIQAIGKGKREPYKPEDSSQYTKDDIQQLNRRVEWHR